MLDTILGIYFCGLMLTSAGAYLAFSKGERRLGARLALLTPVWPAVAIIGAVIGIRHLWKIADWKGRQT
ncbi:hypothetical protein [Arthrobacter sp. StoSoilB22]|uniref:hypothetical protein n=1 Tax=Arthrobacter sp. StoSoilB22 TaxID=2830996 RepID=UPI001CC7C574|nr:hypothetical protein [Arthrobacter sp. StoSoilB22]BCW61869.1 hypothetical protein StoSoilB22_08420 [Arthrobacter sp. StoSoilB22]